MAEDLGDVVPQAGDEGGDGGVVRGAVTAQGDEGDVLTAGAFDPSAADNALAVGEQDDLEQHGRRIGGRAGLVVLVAGVKTGQVQFVIDQMVECVLEGAGQQLPFKIDSNESWAGVDVFVAGHAGLLQNFKLEPCHAIWFAAECGHEETFSTASLGISLTYPGSHMGQTIGSQFFGPWYDIIGWVAGSAMFFYFAVAAEGMPPNQKKRLPAFLLNKKLCIAIGLFMALLGIGKVLKWW